VKKDTKDADKKIQKDKESERENEAKTMIVQISRNRRTLERLYKEQQVEQGK
jgi:hypothetical protein